MPPISAITTDSGGDYTLVVSHTPITDRRLSLADLGLYVRCRWLNDVCDDIGDVEWFIREFDMPADETRAGLRRLADAGHIEVVGPEFVEARRAYERAQAVATAAEESRNLFSEAEAVVVARFVALANERSERASQASALIARLEIEATYQAPDS
ncbi:hypothetical protein OG689_44305 [Kitasatospora sp. NBC_00240]|uniref:Uncharacterized protein n=1 Tax=Kitasatospora herbaricolor TaxID=68217 RepID=A0ABZ1WLS5_9ACTN|nr:MULTISPECIES: hypothetical protein [Kitasatospora]MCX5216161.1 hypothetical protein [Kitasatospora sp. NBC_00240]